MSIAHAGAASQGTNGIVTSLGLTRTATAIGNLLIVGMQVASGTAVPTISDTQGNTWVVANPNFQDATNVSTMRSWYALAKNISSTTITVQSNVSAVFMSMVLDEFTGNDTVSPLDQVNHSTVGASGTPTSGAVTPTFNDELIWAYGVDSVTAVGNIDGSAATKGGDDGSSDWSEFRVLSGRSGISMTAAFTGSGAYDVLIATYKPPIGSAPALGSHRPFPYAPGSPTLRGF